MTEPEKPIKDLPGLAAFASMGMTLAVCEGLGVWVGLWLNHVLPWPPVGLLLGVVLGSTVAVVSVVKQVRRFF